MLPDLSLSLLPLRGPNQDNYIEVRVLWPHRAGALAWSEGGKEGFLAEVVFKLRLKSIPRECMRKREIRGKWKGHGEEEKSERHTLRCLSQ